MSDTKTRMTTEEFIRESGIPPVYDEYQVAERLVLLIHRGVDWDIWGGARRVRYWDALTDRVKAATYSGNTLSHWWQYIGADMPSEPKNAQDRKEAAYLIASENQRKILKILREESSTLVLRIRVVSEIMRERRAEKINASNSSEDNLVPDDDIVPVEYVKVESVDELDE